MEQIEEIVKDFEEYLSLMDSTDLFSSALLKRMREFVDYKKQEERKDSEIARFQKNQRDLPDMGWAAEPLNHPIRLSLDRIIQYAQKLTLRSDVKTIQLLLFELVGKQCSDEQYQMICDLGCGEKARVTKYDIKGDYIENQIIGKE